MPARRPRVRRGYVPTESEAAFQRKVLSLAGLTGWLRYHAPAGGKGGRVDFEQVGRGFPDIVLVRAPRLVFAELKAEDGGNRATVAQRAARPAGWEAKDVTDAQVEWLRSLLACGAEAYLWRPSDWPTVERVLR